MKFQRRYKLTVEITKRRELTEAIGPALPDPTFIGPKPSTAQTTTQAIEIRSPLTLELDIARSTQSSLNSATFRVYNLSETNRSLIFQNRFSINDVSGNRKKVILQAGYETALNRDDDLSTIFVGNLLEAYSYRQGSDVITYINAQDGALGAYNSNINQTIRGGTSFRDIAKIIIGGITGITEGKVGDIQGVSKTSTALNGNNFYLLKKNYKEEVFIDLEKINVLNENEYIKTTNEYIKTTGGKVPLINTDTGLLGTPQRQGTDLVMDVIFEPRLQVGQLAEVQSKFNPKFDGQYKIMGLRHSGIISGAVGGKCTTSLNLFIGYKLLGGLKGV